MAHILEAETIGKYPDQGDSSVTWTIEKQLDLATQSEK